MSKHSRIFTRLKDHFASFSHFFDSMDKTTHTIDNDEFCDHLIRFKSKDILIEFSFLTLDSEKKPLPIEQQYVGVKCEFTDRFGDKQEYDVFGFSLSSFKEKCNHFFSMNSGYSIYKDMNKDIDIASLSLNNLIKAFIQEDETNDIKILVADFDNEINSISVSNERLNIIKNVSNKAQDAYDKEYKSLSNMTEINALEAKLKKLKEEENKLKISLFKKHNIEHHIELSENVEDKNSEYKRHLFLEMLAFASKKKYNVSIKDIENFIY